MAGAARRARDGERPAWPGGTAAGRGGSMAGGTTTIADRAVEADPLLPGADELLAVVDVLLASSMRSLPEPSDALRMAGAGSPAPAVEDVAGAGASSCRSSGS